MRSYEAEHNRPETAEAAIVIADLLKVVDMLMPGVGAIAVSDYALLNDAPLRARRWLAAHARTADQS